MEKQKNAVGRRKEAVTRVFLSKGNGNITVNGKDYKVYFPLVYLQNQVEAPLKTIEGADKFDVVVTIRTRKVSVLNQIDNENPQAGSVGLQRRSSCCQVGTG